MPTNKHSGGGGETPVLIVGGGPVGLALAVELGLRGVGCTLVDARDGTVGLPKMTQVNARSMEFCRRWGIAQAVESVGWPAEDPQDFVYVTTLSGPELARSRWAPHNAGAERHITPNGNAHCPQIFFDPILRGRASGIPGVWLRYRTRLDSFVDDGARIRARLTDVASGATEEIVARYLVGCDGAESAVRSALGIALLGEGCLSHSLSLYFRSAELWRVHDKGRARFFRLHDETGHWADLISIDGKALWRLTLLGLADPMAAESVDADAIFWRAIGARFAYELLSIVPWERRDQVAESYGKGRAFIAGDAAHQLSPTGGLGMNAGLADAVDLGWKLAAALAGWGGPALLASYEAERKPVALRVVAESTAYYRRTRGFPGGKGINDPTPEGARLRLAYKAEFDRLNAAQILYISEHVKLGYCYEPSPICVPDGTPPIDATGEDYVPNARPGARAPHLWLADESSILDLFGAGFVLLRFGADAPPADALVAAARAKSVPLRMADIAQADACRLYASRLVLVRPDGHVAWRGDRVPDNAAALIERVRGA